MIVPAPKLVRRSAELSTLVAVRAERVESFRNWIAPNVPAVAPSAALMTIEPTELNSNALFLELAIIIYCIT
tara:strand:- start:262 stop:477 length:216 start_codon:yes stop_codon:yes gene_type:complete